jgi:hypothetical protein
VVGWIVAVFGARDEDAFDGAVTPITDGQGAGTRRVQAVIAILLAEPDDPLDGPQPAGALERPCPASGPLARPVLVAGGGTLGVLGTSRNTATAVLCVRDSKDSVDLRPSWSRIWKVIGPQYGSTQWLVVPLILLGPDWGTTQ